MLCSRLDINLEIPRINGQLLIIHRYIYLVDNCYTASKLYLFMFSKNHFTFHGSLHIGKHIISF